MAIKMRQFLLLTALILGVMAYHVYAESTTPDLQALPDIVKMLESARTVAERKQAIDALLALMPAVENTGDTELVANVLGLLGDK